MIINKKMINLYDGIIAGDILNDNTLKIYGFSEEEINELLEEKILKCNNNCYDFLAISQLYRYGHELYLKREYNKSKECYKKCFQLNPDQENVMCKIVETLINKDQYYEALKYLNYTLNNNNINFYLYLLSFFVRLPEEHIKHIKKLSFEDIKVDVPNDENKKNDYENKMRKSAYDMKFSFALKQLNDDIRKNNKYNDEQAMLIKTLLIRAIKRDKYNMSLVLNLIAEKEYEKVIAFINAQEEKRKLSPPDKIIRILAMTILEINETRIIPTPKHTDFNEENLTQAVLYNDYSLALKINNRYNESFHIPPDESLIHLLLVDLCKLINEIQLEQILSKPLNKSSNTLTEKERTELEVMIGEKMLLVEEEKDVVLLENLSLEKIEYLKKIISNYDNFDIFSLNKTNTLAVLRPVAEDNEYYELNNMYYFADIAFEEEDYTLCSQYYLEILKVGSPRCVHYLKLGLCYMNMGVYEKALMYFKIAKNLVYSLRIKANIDQYIDEINTKIQSQEEYARVRK